MGAGEKTGAGSRERDPPRFATFPAPTPDGVSATGARRGCGIRLARREGTDGEGEGRDRRTGTRSGNRETGTVTRRAGRSALRRREPGSQPRDRSARGTRAGERQVPAAVRGGRATRGGAGRGHRTGNPGTAGPAVGRSEGSVLIAIAPARPPPPAARCPPRATPQAWRASRAPGRTVTAG